MFEFLFKYRPVVFERGDLTFGLPAWALLLAIATITVLVPFLLHYRDLAPHLSRRDRWTPGLLRVGVLAIVAFSLFRPALVVSTVVPRQNFVAVLMDDSRSMRIVDEGGESRGASMLELLADEGAGGLAPGSLRRDLAERFRLRTYSFGTDAHTVDATDSLRFAEERTSLARALDRVRQDLDGLPVSGIVVATDGADNGDEALSEALTSIKAAGLPVYAVGLGEERIAPDVEVRRVEVPRRALEGTTIVADVILSHAGLAGRTVRLDVEDDGRLLGSSDVELGGDGETPVQVQFSLDESGPRVLEFSTAPLEGEAVLENNARSVVLDVRSDARRILYFEGVARPELKFVRRAVADDANLRLVTLLRSADEKFLRLGVDDPQELVAGFPATREELYEYDGLVLGDVEASFFTHDQLQMISDFVSRRGGGLLVLGGHNALAEGGYAGTPLADALPVVLDAPDGTLREVHAEPTLAGRRHPAMRLAETAEASAERWSALPPVTTRNSVTRIKPGAVTLATGRPTDEGAASVLLAFQRFGRGTSIAFTTQDSWLWQMHADIPLEDQTHERLWKQLLRWLVHEAPGRLELDLAEETVVPDQPVKVRATLDDERFLRVNGSEVTATIKNPDGSTSTLPLSWTVERDGEYEATFVPPEAGLYEISVAGGETAAGASVYATGFLRAGRPQREAFGAGRRTDLLRRIAEETGGGYYTPARAGDLANEIRYSESGDTVREVHPLWDMPILLLLLGLLLTAEWVHRKRKELA